jgi:hypothetical protein
MTLACLPRQLAVAYLFLVKWLGSSLLSALLQYFFLLNFTA